MKGAFKSKQSGYPQRRRGLIIKGEKYIYLLMGYMLAKAGEGRAKIGNDTGYTGGQQYERVFKISEYQGKTILSETKTGSNFADYHRYYEVSGELPKPVIKEYFNESGENCSNNWTH